MNIKKYSLIIILTMFIILTTLTVTSLDIALTPGSLNFGTVLRDGFSQGSFKFSTYSEKPITVMLYNSQPNSLMNSWIYMHSVNGSDIKIGDKIQLDKNHPLIIFITFEPANDAPNGDYDTTIGATVEVSADTSENVGETVAKIKTGISIRLSGSINDVESISCSATNLIINSPENGESVIFNTRIKNTGNIILNPRLEIEIWDKDKTRLIKKIDGNLGMIKPTINAETQYEFDSSNLPPNEYVASVSLKQCNVENKLMSFRVLEIGTKNLDGRIKSLDIPSIVYGFKPLRIRVTFENFGSQSVASQAICHIYKDNIEIVPPPVSEKSIIVKAKESAELDSGYFTPVQTKNDEDRYVAKCYVHYGNKQTDEYSKVFFVKKEAEKKSNNPAILIVGMVLLILILIGVIIKRNK